jgi:hypothetical protein
VCRATIRGRSSGLKGADASRCDRPTGRPLTPETSTDPGAARAGRPGPAPAIGAAHRSRPAAKIKRLELHDRSLHGYGGWTHPPQTAEEGGPRRPPTRPGHRPTPRQRTPRPPTHRPVRTVWATSPGAGAPGPQARPPHHAGTAATTVDAADGQDAAQDADRLPALPRPRPQPATCQHAHVAVTGEPVAGTTGTAGSDRGSLEKGLPNRYLASDLPVLHLTLPDARRQNLRLHRIFRSAEGTRCLTAAEPESSRPWIGLR